MSRPVHKIMIQQKNSRDFMAAAVLLLLGNEI